MRVVAEQNNVVISVAEKQDAEALEDGTLYTIQTLDQQLQLGFDHEPGCADHRQGVNELTFLTVLLDRTLKLLSKEPEEKYKRAFYHLTKAQECFKQES